MFELKVMVKIKGYGKIFKDFDPNLILRKQIEVQLLIMYLLTGVETGFCQKVSKIIP